MQKAKLFSFLIVACAIISTSCVGQQTNAQYDAIVVGAGLGGLTSGAKLCKEGKKVLIIEQHAISGGCATAFKRKGYTMECSLHEMDGLDKGDPKLEILKELGVLDEVTFLKIPNFYRFINGRVDVVVPHNITKAIDTLSTEFPEETKGIKKFFKHIQVIRKEINRVPLDRWKWIFAAPLAPFLYPHLILNLRKNVGQYLDSIIDNDDLKLVLLGALCYYHDDPYTLSLLYFSSAQASYFIGGGHYIKGGSGTLARHLTDKIKKYGGEILTGHSVQKVLTDKGTAIGVQYVNKKDKDAVAQTAYARVIIANAAIPNVVKMLKGKAHAKLEKKVGKLKPACSILPIYICFKTAVKDLGNKYYSTFVFDPSIKTQKDILPNIHGDYAQRLFVFVDYSQVGAGLAPEGKSVGTICTVDYASDWEGLSKEEYQERKKYIGEVFLDRLEKLIPGIKDEIEHYEVATPRTIEGFTRNPGGVVYGYAQTPDQALLHRPQVKSPVKNLYFASAWSMPGGGFSGAILSGMFCSREVLKKI